MALGIPKPITRIYKKFVSHNSRLERIIIPLYYFYLKFYIKLCVKWKYKREKAPLYPFRLIWVKPSDIKTRMVSKKPERLESWLIPKIEDGNWHEKCTSSFDDYIYNSIERKFSENRNWQDTELYQRNIAKIRGDIENPDYHTYYCNSEEELQKKLNKIDKLYENIKKRGYKTQKEIKGHKNKVTEVLKIDDRLNEINEVAVNIGPNGEIIQEEGKHRLAIAKLLKIERIPVRVLIRHRKWQNKRNTAVTSPEELSEDLKNHPDIKYLVE